MTENKLLPMNSDEAIGQGLAGKTVAIVGLSGNTDSPSYHVGHYLQRHGYHIIPVNPTEESVLGEVSYKSLRDVPGQVDVVDVFRKPEAVPAIAEEAARIGAKVLWMQLGVVSEEAAQIAQEAGITVVMDHCMKIEHSARRSSNAHS